ncbi:MAG: GAF domain-containing protein [Nannocystaceae bacterium]
MGSSLLAQVVDAIMELCNAERGVAVLLPWREEQARIEVVRELQAGSDGASFSHSIIDRVLASSEPILSVDATSDARFDGSRSISHLHLRSVLGVPLIWRGQVLGAAYVVTAPPRRLRRARPRGGRGALRARVAGGRPRPHPGDPASRPRPREPGRALLEERELEVRGLREQVASGRRSGRSTAGWSAPRRRCRRSFASSIGSPTPTCRS